MISLDTDNSKDPGKRGHIAADTLLPTKMFPRLPARTTFVADTNFVSGTQKLFLILFRNILCPQQMFSSLRSMETQHSFCVPRVCAPKKHHEQQCVRNNVPSPFARALMMDFYEQHYCGNEQREVTDFQLFTLVQTLRFLKL